MPLLDGLPWDSIPGDRIREISADERGHLSCMPSKWTAGQISSFVCGRPDWPFLASVYICVCVCGKSSQTRIRMPRTS